MPPSSSRSGLSQALALLTRKGRGASHNPPVRFDRHAADSFDDGWGTVAAMADDLPALATTLSKDNSRSAISWNNSPDLGFDRAVNPYRGCEHGCIYCFARPSHAWLGLSPGLDFETRLTYKPDIARLLEQELRKPGYACAPIVLGSNTDPYQPVERTLELTRRVLEVLEHFAHPVSIVTKSAGILRDRDILARMAARNLAQVRISVTTLDGRLARLMEPRATAPGRRLAAIAALADAGIPVGVLAAPMIPGLNDAELDHILQAGARAGASRAGYGLLRLPLELSDLFETWLQAHFPDRARHVLALIRQTREGALNQPALHDRFRGTGPYAALLAQRFAAAARKCGIAQTRLVLDTSQFRSPGGNAQQRQAVRQMSLL